MGCCESSKNLTSATFVYKAKMQVAIDRNSAKSIELLFKTFSPRAKAPGGIDEIFITVDEIEMNPLAYSFWVGKIISYTHILNKLGASIITMENLFERQNKVPVNILCSKGYFEVFQSYLPRYLLNISKKKKIEENVSIDFQGPILVETKLTKNYTPLQLACENGHLMLVDYIHRLFIERVDMPALFDVNCQDERTGENCALIACRSGNYAMVKFLHEICNANFYVLNSRNESAIHVTAVASKRNPRRNYFDIFVYLIDIVKVDYKYMYEEALLTMEDRQIINFYEFKLRKIGIDIRKATIERYNRIIPQSTVRSSPEREFDDQNEGFQIKNYIDENEFEISSVLSRIPSEFSNLNTPFMSALIAEGNKN